MDKLGLLRDLSTYEANFGEHNYDQIGRELKNISSRIQGCQRTIKGINRMQTGYINQDQQSEIIGML